MTVTLDRTTRIGASEAAAILGLSPYKTPYEVWLEKTRRIEQWTGNEATRAGQRLEPLLLDHAERDLGDLMRDVFVPGRGEVPIGATLDAQVVSTGEVVECKTSGLTGGPVVGNWGEPGTDEIPESYLIQTQVQMWCARAEQAHVYAFLGNVLPKRYLVNYDSQLAEAIVDKLISWWNYHVIGDMQPEETFVPMEVYKRMKRQPESLIELGDESAAEVRKLIEQMESAKAVRKQVDSQIDELQSQIVSYLGSTECAVLPDGARITYLETVRKGYVVKDSSYRTLRIKEKK